MWLGISHSHLSIISVVASWVRSAQTRNSPATRRKTTPLLSGPRRFDGGIELYYFNVECSFRNGVEDGIYVDHLRDRRVVLRQGVETTVTIM